jgi:hypothetical protein
MVKPGEYSEVAALALPSPLPSPLSCLSLAQVRHGLAGGRRTSAGCLCCPAPASAGPDLPHSAPAALPHRATAAASPTHMSAFSASVRCTRPRAGTLRRSSGSSSPTSARASPRSRSSAGLCLLPSVLVPLLTRNMQERRGPGERPGLRPALRGPVRQGLRQDHVPVRRRRPRHSRPRVPGRQSRRGSLHDRGRRRRRRRRGLHRRRARRAREPATACRAGGSRAGRHRAACPVHPHARTSPTHAAPARSQHARAHFCARSQRRRGPRDAGRAALCAAARRRARAGLGPRRARRARGCRRVPHRAGAEQEQEQERIVELNRTRYGMWKAMEKVSRSTSCACATY